MEEDIMVKQKVCEEDLEKAEPALTAAMAALNTLNKVNYHIFTISHFRDCDKYKTRDGSTFDIKIV